MSGHSHWSTIQRQKGAADHKRGQTFTKLANMITVAAKMGNNGDPDSNPRLRMSLESARQVNMPKDNIQRAIDRGLGKLPGQILEEVTYEGFGPNKVAFLVEAITDNKLRTLQEVRNMFDRAGGALGGTGSAMYMFDKVGQLIVAAKIGETDDQILELIDLGADDVDDFKDEGVVKFDITTQPQQLAEVSTKIVQSGFIVLESGLVFKPNLTVNVENEEAIQKVINLIDKIEENDDIQKVYTNLITNG